MTNWIGMACCWFPLMAIFGEARGFDVFYWRCMATVHLGTGFFFFVFRRDERPALPPDFDDDFPPTISMRHSSDIRAS